ncbi:MAG: type I-C CRISPR-associated protein Cas8c/Csd1 [Gammaproteobacteria bacterium]|nr:type I-C CRISPR-associated protein Cas8c/Csd1 [Gammaproteobacteria bacterium]
MILSALNNYYERLASNEDSGIAPRGYSAEKISYAVVLDITGHVVSVQDLRDTTYAKPLPKRLIVPASTKRTGQVFKPFLFWDKTSYALGISGKVEKLRKKQESSQQLSNKEKDDLEKMLDRLSKEHESFRSYHVNLLENPTDEGLTSFLRFLNTWNPDTFLESNHFLRLGEDFLDSNVVFRLDGKRELLHERSAAKELVPQDGLQSEESECGNCLVTGKHQTIARIHESIKGVAGAQSSGASIVSFNKDSFGSYGKSQGYNAPVSKRAAAAYVTALNFLLRHDDGNRQRLQIGDTTVVFWAEAAHMKQAIAGENLLSTLLDVKTDETETCKLQSALTKISKGRPLSELDPELDEETQIYVLGLAPNTSRLSIRFWEADSLKNFTARLAQHYQDLYLNPQPWKNEPAVWRLIRELVPYRENNKPKLNDVPPQLAGELTRAILTGQRYPRSLLTNVLMRIRADGHFSPLRVALCKAVLCRNTRFTNTQKKEIPVSIDIQNQDPGYVLGRLFASLESCQRNALGREVNATIRERYFGAASATPAAIFPLLVRNAQHHLGKVKKDKPGLAVILERQIGEIIELLGSEFPGSLSLQAQGRFVIGYYHQQQSLLTKHKIQPDHGDEK